MCLVTVGANARHEKDKVFFAGPRQWKAGQGKAEKRKKVRENEKNE